MNLGFIGTGKIASSVITGICKSSIKYEKIIISSRNKTISNNLKKNLKKFLLRKKIKISLINVTGFFYALRPRLVKK
jgi:pyrroline-5-carboxylate reductase